MTPSWASLVSPFPPRQRSSLLAHRFPGRAWTRSLRYRETFEAWRCYYPRHPASWLARAVMSGNIRIPKNFKNTIKNWVKVKEAWNILIPSCCWPGGSRMEFQTQAPQGLVTGFHGDRGTLGLLFLVTVGDRLAFLSWSLACKLQAVPETLNCQLNTKRDNIISKAAAIDYFNNWSCQSFWRLIG